MIVRQGYKNGIFVGKIFKKGHIPWHKGKHIQLSNSLETWRKKGGQVWNKGKHIVLNNALEIWRKNNGHNNTEIKKGQHFSPKTEFKKGLIHTDKFRKYMSKVMQGRKFTEEWKKKIGKANTKLGLSKTKEYARFHRIKRRTMIKDRGGLSIQTIQRVYEDNIKYYGTLTCYLCLQPMPFGKDHLEHKIPISRGGNSLYSNLGIACQKCNFKKHTKTEEEFKKMEVYCAR